MAQITNLFFLVYHFLRKSWLKRTHTPQVNRLGVQTPPVPDGSVETSRFLLDAERNNVNKHKVEGIIMKLCNV